MRPVRATAPGCYGVTQMTALATIGMMLMAAGATGGPPDARGERLASTGAADVWWTASGWKVNRGQAAPEDEADAVLIRAARNEAEAAQIVVRPRQALCGFRAASGALTGPAGAVIPAAAVEVLRVRYVRVARATDRVGRPGDWPDPLPPFNGPIDLPAGRNQPLWVRVTVPRGTRPGAYTGAVRMTADEFSADVPLRVEVYDFDLPDRTTCTTAFGFSPGDVWRYHRLTAPADRRAVLAKYWSCFASHHISPYDPAPLDPIRVTWPSAGAWEGGRRDATQKHSGASSLVVVDGSTTSQVNARYAQRIPIPPKGFRLTFWYRTQKPGHRFIVTLDHHDAGGRWMSGRNNDMPLTGDGTWQPFDRRITSFPDGAASVGLRLWAAVWRNDGSPTGTVWFDDVHLRDGATGRDLVAGGGFEPVDPASLAPTFDWRAWDAAMTAAIDTHHFTSFRLPPVGLGGGTFHSRREPELLGYGEKTPEYQAAFTAYWRALQAHLREKGWLDEAFVYWFDEPNLRDYGFVMNGFRKLKAAAPGINRMLTEQVEDALIGGPNIWCPVSSAFQPARSAGRRAAGDRFWWYVCTGPKAPYCGLFIDHPATEMRVWLWQTWQRGIDGILVWQTTYWTSRAAYPDPERLQNPYADPMGWVSSYGTKPGTKRPWGNGDGRFIYPPEAAAGGRQKEAVLDGPVDSIRWEMLRDGIEDYEYLAMLRRLLDARGADLPEADRARFTALLDVPPAITKTMTAFTIDPAPIDARRHEVARAIERVTRLATGR